MIGLELSQLKAKSGCSLIAPVVDVVVASFPSMGHSQPQQLESQENMREATDDGTPQFLTSFLVAHDPVQA